MNGPTPSQKEKNATMPDRHILPPVPQLNDWILACTGTTQGQPRAWELGKIEAVEDQHGTNRTTIYEDVRTLPGRPPIEPRTRYVLPSQVIGVYACRVDAQVARALAINAMLTTQPILQRMEKALSDMRDAVTAAITDGARDVTMPGRFHPADEAA
ncbi:hypothetical protein BAJUN_00530 [Bajunvirus bajun]|uniref:Uncharacterized protein n=1 Tax=Brevundimonas phage vB_BgoS-Bajun TaxID=2948594 RepID=A0A9E7N6J5_9CAUD|nr:hypothetical protein BAJUN_00530 [Brevundimonas phage vB_BgoS-Bajun]